MTGVIAAIFGSLAGLGGGFLIVPVLRLLFGVSPAVASGNALLFVFANTLAASIAFIRRGAVDIPRGSVIAAAGIPTSIVGAYLVHLFTPRSFDTLYGFFLVGVATMVILQRNAEPKVREVSPRAKLMIEIASGLCLGLISSLFGIGGGIVLIPILLAFFRLPIHTVAATSAFVVMLTSPTGVVAHGIYGDLEPYIGVPLVLGGFVGGSIGARMARRISPRRMTILLASMLFLAALALVLRHVL